MVEAIEQEDSSSNLYALDEAWLEAQGRSLATLIDGRLCPEARSQIGQVREVRTPTTDASGQVVFAVTRTSLGVDAASLMRLLADNCAGSPNYRGARLPVMEIIFRILLANQNVPMSTDQIVETLDDWVRPGDGRILHQNVIERLIASDDFYGVRRVETSDD